MEKLFELTKLTALSYVKEVSFDRYDSTDNTARCIITFYEADYYCVIRPSRYINPGKYEYWDCNSDEAADGIYLEPSQLIAVIINGYKYFVSKM